MLGTLFHPKIINLIVFVINHLFLLISGCFSTIWRIIPSKEATELRKLPKLINTQAKTTFRGLLRRGVVRMSRVVWAAVLPTMGALGLRLDCAWISRCRVPVPGPPSPWSQKALQGQTDREADRPGSRQTDNCSRLLISLTECLWVFLQRSFLQV